MNKIVVLDGYTLNPGDLSWSDLQKLGTLTVYDRTVHDDSLIIERIGDARYVYTNKTVMNEYVLQNCPKLEFVGVLATGYNVVDVTAAKKLGVTVCNIPTYGTDAVAQFAIALLLEVCHHIGHHDQQVHNNRWQQNADWCFWDYPLIELAGKTMGVIGLGRIGQQTARIAQALGMQVLAYDTYQVQELQSDSLHYVPLDDLFQNSDVITLHIPLFAETQGLINRKSIAKMKDGVIIINNSRGPLIIEADLAEALNNGKVRAAGLDVVSTEPIQDDNHC